MDIDSYSEHAASTAKYTTEIYAKIGGKEAHIPWVYPILGLVGETGECLEKAKKALRDHGGQLDLYAFQKELGDIEWYLSELHRQLGLKRSDTLRMNIEKLQARKEQGKISGSGDDREATKEGYSI